MYVCMCVCVYIYIYIYIYIIQYLAISARAAELELAGFLLLFELCLSLPLLLHLQSLFIYYQYYYIIPMVVYYCSIVIIIVTSTISLPLISTWFRSTTNLNHVHYHQPKPSSHLLVLDLVFIYTTIQYINNLHK